MCGVRELGSAVVRVVLTYSADFHTTRSQTGTPWVTSKTDEQVWARHDKGGTQQIIIMKGATHL